MGKPKHSKVDFKKLKEKCHKNIKDIKDEIKDIDYKNIKINKETLKKLDIENIHIRLALSGLMILVILVLGFTGYKINEIRTSAYNVYLGQEIVGTVRKEEEVLSATEDLKDELSKVYNMNVTLKDEIELEKTHVKDKLITSNVDLKENIKSKMKFLVSAYELRVDGVAVGAAKTKKEIEEVLKDIKEPYETNVEEGKKLKEIKVLEDIEIVKKEMQINKVMKSDKLEEVLLTGSQETKTHTVEVGESLWTIAMFYDMTVENLIEANPDKNPELLQIGDEIKLVIPKPMITVATLSELEYDEEIKYETEIEYKDNMYNTHKEIVTDGANGSVKILANEIKHNGYLVDKKIVKEEILKEPVTEVIIQGSKEPPKTMATGVLAMPTRGRISSRYGMRNGRMHRGLDIASSSGTDIKAADGGKVIFTGYKGSYGNLVEIDHENGYKTRYAHNSKILVKVGDRVYKGQTISKMGNTGRSTGSHLHFEVLVNGSNKNPSNFVN